MGGHKFQPVFSHEAAAALWALCISYAYFTVYSTRGLFCFCNMLSCSTWRSTRARLPTVMLSQRLKRRCGWRKTGTRTCFLDPRLHRRLTSRRAWPTRSPRPLTLETEEMSFHSQWPEIQVKQGFFLAVFWAALDSGVSEILSFWKNLGYFGLEFSKSP